MGKVLALLNIFYLQGAAVTRAHGFAESERGLAHMVRSGREVECFYLLLLFVQVSFCIRTNFLTLNSHKRYKTPCSQVAAATCLSDNKSNRYLGLPLQGLGTFL